MGIPFSGETVFTSKHGPGPVLDPRRFKKAYELLDLRALKFSRVNKMHIFQFMGKLFYVEFQMEPFKFHTKYILPMH